MTNTITDTTTATTEPYTPAPGSVIKGKVINSANGIIAHNVTFIDCQFNDVVGDMDIRDTVFEKCDFYGVVVYGHDNSDNLHNITCNNCTLINSSVIGNVWYKLTLDDMLVIDSSVIDNNAYYSTVNDWYVAPDNIATIARNRILP